MPAPTPDPSDLAAALRRHFGYPGFRPGQERLVRAALTGRDALGVLPTGGGKSVCYQLPAHLLDGTVLVVSPLISLMEDQLARARDGGLRAELLNSTLDGGTRRRILERAAVGALDVLFLAPERFRVPAFRARLRDVPVALLAIDEAHCISQWGHDFRPAYLELGRVRRELGVPALALTATATPRVREEIAGVLGLERPERVVLSFDRPNLSWSVLRARGHAGKSARVRALLRGREGGTIVYAATRRAVEAIRRELARLGHPAEAYHAGMAPGARARVQEDFISGLRPVVVATNAFGMGIDKPDVRLVVHYQLPASLEAYYQEGGRAGRDGEAARCVALHGRRDARVHRGFVDRTHPPTRTLRRFHRRLRRALAPGRAGALTPAALAASLAPDVTPRTAVAALQALERAGGVSLFSDPERALEMAGDGGARLPGPGSRASAPPGSSGCARSAGLEAPAAIRLLVRDDLGDLDRERRLRRRALARLRAVGRFARTRRCRLAAILRYFGEDPGPGGCGRCDRCAPGRSAEERRPGLLSALGLR